jgi:hypothetical protein
MWRSIRAVALRTLRVKPKPQTGENVARKIKQALHKIRSTEVERKKMIELTVQAINRQRQRRENGNGHSLTTDPILIELKKEAEKLLGKKRANKFFDLCNDPYF